MATEEFYEITLVGLQRDKRRVLDFLHASGVVHLSPAKDHADSPLGMVPELSDALLTLRWMREGLTIDSGMRSFSGSTLEDTLSRFDALRSSLREPLHDVLERVDKHTAAIEGLSKKRAILERIPFELPRGVRLPHQGPRSFALVVENAPESFDEPLSVEAKDGFALITGPRSLFEETNRMLLESGSKVLSIDPIIRSRADEIVRLSDSITTESIALSRCEDERRALARTHADEVLALERDVTVLRERYETSTSFARTRSTFVVRGFVPRSCLDDVKRIEDHARVDISIEKAVDAPVRLTNNAYARRFEFITRMFGFPSNGTTDPTPFIAVFLPIFFGFMFSDVGYGALLLAGSFLLARIATPRTPVYRDAGFVLAVCALSTILFGFVFGSLFGTLGGLTPIVDPFTNAQAILIAALVLGLIHLNVGVLIATVRQVRERDARSFVLTTIPFLTMQAAIISGVLGWTGLVVGFVAATIGLVLVRSRIMGLIELTGFFGTWFSYARLLALALATAGIALGVNIIAERALTIGWVGPILFVLVVVIGHAFNFALNVLGSSIHSVRLHYIEFFSQFYAAGGEPYRPFETDEKKYTI